MPVPMMAPIPSAVRLIQPSDFLRRFSGFSESSRSWSILLRRKSCDPIVPLRQTSATLYSDSTHGATDPEGATLTPLRRVPTMAASRTQARHPEEAWMATGSARLRELLARSPRVVALTGAGISAESGVPTFRSRGGFWENERVEDLATPEGFARDPRRVWAWYDARRAQIAACSPNAGHLALARFGRTRPGFTLVTQNVDGLHRAAGSEGVIALHGDIFRVRCTRDDAAMQRDDPLAAGGPV